VVLIDGIVVKIRDGNVANRPIYVLRVARPNRRISVRNLRGASLKLAAIGGTKVP
jgi:hypothetical protein